MNYMKRFAGLVCAVAAIAFFASCSKDKESGTLSFDSPAVFLSAGQTVKVGFKAVNLQNLSVTNKPTGWVEPAIDLAAQTLTITAPVSFEDDEAKTGSLVLAGSPKGGSSVSATLFVGVVNSEDLSGKPANSYIVSKPETNYLISSMFRGDLMAVLPASVDVVWQSKSGLIQYAELREDGMVSFYVGADSDDEKKIKEGNAVIGAYDAGGTLMWSWHIWAVNYDPEASAVDFNGLKMMDRNLGALNNTPMDVGNRGMFYEWGRKDPFTPSRSPYHADTDGNNVPAYNEPNTAIGDGTGTWVYNAQAAVLATPPANIPNSILNPMTYLQSPYNGHADWYCTGTDPKATHPGLWGPEKTIFDPCPPGYKVPGPDLWGIPAGNNSITNGGAAADYDETGVSAKWDWNAYEDCGRRWKNTGDYYPMAGNIYYTDYISVSICNYTGGMAFYWTAQATPDATKSSAYFVNFNPNWCNYRLGAHDCSAQIRCIRE